MTKTCPNNLFKTYLVSYPRSGHHLMQRGLEAALGHKLVYSEYYNCVHNFETCEYVNLQKSHDFDLALPIRDDMKYIVMVRDREDANESWLKSGDNAPIGYSQDIYDRFYEKWITDTFTVNRLVIRYDKFIRNKLLYIVFASTFMGCTDPDYTNIGEWLKREERHK